MGLTATAEKHNSNVNSDKLHFPRANLQTITTLGRCRRPSRVHTRDPPRHLKLTLCLVDGWPGKGEFGEVLLCKAKGIEESEEEVVVLVKSLQTRDEQLQLDFRREAEMFGKLGHPNVARLLGLCKEAEPHYMILDYYDLVTQTAKVCACSFHWTLG